MTLAIAIAFLMGLFFGANLGILAAAICCAAGRADRWRVG